MFLQQIVNGLSVGSVYALIASGYSLIYSLLGFSNWAHGDIAMVGAYVALIAQTSGHVPFWLAVVLAIAGAGCVSMLSDVVAYRRIRNNHSPKMFLMIAAMGLSITFQNLIMVTVGPRFRTYGDVIPVRSIRLGGISLGVLDLLTMGIIVVALIALGLLIGRTKFGLGVRAASSNMETASVMGVDVNLYIRLVFLLAGVFAGMAGVLLGLKYNIYPTMGNIALKAFIACVVGGLGSVPGAILGGVTIGVMEALVGGFISSGLRDAFTFALLITILLVRPSGLLGKNIVDKA